MRTRIPRTQPEGTNQKKEEKSTKKDVEEGIKTCDGVVEKREKRLRMRSVEKHLLCVVRKCKASLKKGFGETELQQNQRDKQYEEMSSI